MFTKSHDWRRWSGPRGEITVAIGLASEVLEQWSSIPSKANVRVLYANQLTETSPDSAALDRIHVTDLRAIKDVWIDVETDVEWWRRRTDEYNERKIKLRFNPDPEDTVPLIEPPQLVISSVSFRLGSRNNKGMHVDVQGPDRTNVEGLMARLVQTLDRSASGPTNFTPEWALILCSPFAVFASLFASSAVHALHIAPIDNGWQWQEITFPIVAFLATYGVSALIVWLFPKLELLDSETHSRFRRYRALFFSGLGTICTGLIAAVIFAAFSEHSAS